mgnify:FL=1
MNRIKELMIRNQEEHFRTLNQHMTFLRNYEIDRTKERQEYLSSLTPKERTKLLRKEKFDKWNYDIKYRLKKLFNLRLKLVDKDDWEDMKNGDY